MQTSDSSNCVAFEDHPSVRAVRRKALTPAKTTLTIDQVRELAMQAGADDASIVSLGHPDLQKEKSYVLAAMPDAQSLIVFVLRTHPDNIRSPSRTIANLEFHRTGDAVDEVARRIAISLTNHGHRALNPPMAFPMEMSEFPDRTWVVSHKHVAVAAQLGRMGIHRSLIHPRFGSFVLLGTVMTSAVIAGSPAALEFNPCIGCKLCVAACPVGAIESDGTFRFSACYHHNYREFMTGFTDFVENVVESNGRNDFRDRVALNESMSTWQSLAYKPSYKAAHCIAVCPAGEDVLGVFVERRGQHVRNVVKPLTDRVETVYVVKGSDAEAHVRKRFPHKRLQRIRSSLRATSAKGFFQSLPLTFQRGPAKGWAATYHFELTGADAVRATVRIDDGTIEVQQGELVGKSDIRVEAEASLWIDIVNKRRSAVLAVLKRRLDVRGNRSLLVRFAQCFPQ